MIFSFFANSQQLGVVLIGAVYQTGGSNTFKSLLSKLCFSQTKRNTIGRIITHPQVIVIDVTRALGWLTRHEFCRSFRNTALKEIGKINTVYGRKFLLSLLSHVMKVGYRALHHEKKWTLKGNFVKIQDLYLKLILQKCRL